MNWIQLTADQHINDIKERSREKLQVIFKHSTRCSLSAMAKSRLERSIIPANIDFHFLDLIRFRSLSDKIADTFTVYHESPQVLLIKNGECIYDESHSGISMDEISGQLNRV